jgi:hypothetical protein
MCSTLPWPLSGWSLQFVFAVLTRRSPIGVSGCQGGDPEGGAERALTQERAAITLRGLPRTENRSGQSQARGAAPELRPSPRLPRQALAMGRRPPVPGSTQPGSQRPLDLPRSAATPEGCGGTVPPRCPPAHARAASGRARCRADRCTVTAARACGGLDAAEAAPRRCAPGRSRGQRWSGPGGPLGRATLPLSAVGGAAWSRRHTRLGWDTRPLPRVAGPPCPVVSFRRDRRTRRIGTAGRPWYTTCLVRGKETS